MACRLKLWRMKQGESMIETQSARLAVLELMLREKESEVREAMARNGLAAGQVNGGAVRARISEHVEGDEDD